MNLVGIIEQYEVHEYETMIKYVTVGYRFKIIGRIARKQNLANLKIKRSTKK